MSGVAGPPVCGGLPSESRRRMQCSRGRKWSSRRHPRSRSHARRFPSSCLPVDADGGPSSSAKLLRCGGGERKVGSRHDDGRDQQPERNQDKNNRPRVRRRWYFGHIDLTSRGPGASTSPLPDRVRPVAEASGPTLNAGEVVCRLRDFRIVAGGHRIEQPRLCAVDVIGRALPHRLPGSVCPFQLSPPRSPR